MYCNIFTIAVIWISILASFTAGLPVSEPIDTASVTTTTNATAINAANFGNVNNTDLALSVFGINEASLNSLIASFESSGTAVAGKLGKRLPALPPDDRKFVDQMEHYHDMPECMKQCMRQHDGEYSVHMGQDTAKDYCGIKNFFYSWWIREAVLPCLWATCKEKGWEEQGRNWVMQTCGRLP